MAEQSKIVVSACSPLDALNIYALDSSCFKVGYSPQMIDRMLIDNFALKAELSGQIIGYIALQLIPPEAEIIKIAVKEQLRGKGIGQLILDEAIRQCLKKGVSRIFLEVNEVNNQAIMFYKKTGFSIISVRQKYYEDKAALIMQKEVTA